MTGKNVYLVYDMTPGNESTPLGIYSTYEGARKKVYDFLMFEAGYELEEWEQFADKHNCDVHELQEYILKTSDYDDFFDMLVQKYLLQD